MPPVRSSIRSKDPVAAGSGSVLVLDDERLIGNLMAQLLRDDHEVDVTPSAREALSWLRAGRDYDVILCDVVMAEMSGLDFHAELARERPEAATRIVFMTGGAPVALQRRLDALPNVVIAKPIKAEALRKIVQSHVEAVGLERH
jgi:CheY-like chemotaxis protein